MKLDTAREYRMTARADAAARTGERILEAALELFWEAPTTDISLAAVAARAGVSARTVIRRFGGKEGLVAAAAEYQTTKVSAQRGEAPAGDIPAAVVVLVEHYEQLGDGVLRMLAAEESMPTLAPIVENGRRLHWEWCQRVFGPYLAAFPARTRRQRLAEVVAVTDIYNWKILRRDASLSRTATQTTMTRMLTRLIQEEPCPESSPTPRPPEGTSSR